MDTESILLEYYDKEKKKLNISSKSGEKRMKDSNKAKKKTSKVSSALIKKGYASSKNSKARVLKKEAPRISQSQKMPKTKSSPAAKKLLPSIDNIKEFLQIAGSVLQIAFWLSMIYKNFTC